MNLYTATTIVALLLAVTAIAAGQEQEDTEQTTEQQEPVSEPTVKLVHVLNPGEREYLSPNLIGVQNIAMTFLPLSMNFVNVIDAHREIVNGVRYEIVLNAIDTKAKDADIICRLVILEKPWLTTQWGDKFRELVNSNCTDEADNQLTSDIEDQSKDKYTRNIVFNGGQRNELSDNEMAALEPQIMSGPSKRRASKVSTTTTSSTTTTTTTERASTNEPTTAISADGATDVAPTPSNEEDTTQIPAELNDNEKQWLDDFLSVGAYNFEQTIGEKRIPGEQQTPLTEANNYQVEPEPEPQQEEQPQPGNANSE